MAWLTAQKAETPPPRKKRAKRLASIVSPSKRTEPDGPVNEVKERTGAGRGGADAEAAVAAEEEDEDNEEDAGHDVKQGGFMRKAADVATNIITLFRDPNDADNLEMHKVRTDTHLPHPVCSPFRPGLGNVFARRAKPWLRCQALLPIPCIPCRFPLTSCSLIPLPLYAVQHFDDHKGSGYLYMKAARVMQKWDDIAVR